MTVTVVLSHQNWPHTPDGAFTMPETPSIFEQEHEDFRVHRARLHGEGGRPPPRPVGEGRAGQPRGLAKAGEMGLLCFDVDEEYGGAGIKDFRYNAVIAEEISRVGASGLGFPVHTDIIVPYISTARHRRAEAALAARPGQRRADLGDRDDRAGRRLRPAGHPHQRRRQGRPLRAQRLEDVHLQRHPERPGHRGLPHRPRRRPPGHQPARRRARHGGLRARPQPRQDGPEGAGHRRAVLRQRAWCPRRTSSARRARASSA